MIPLLALLAAGASAAPLFDVDDFVSLCDLQVPATPTEALVLPLDLGDRWDVLELHRTALRSPDFRVRVPLPDGRLADQPAPPPATYRGTLRGRPGSRVAASLVATGLQAVILDADGGTYFVLPLADLVPGAARTRHVVHAQTEDASLEGRCAALGSPLPTPRAGSGAPEAGTCAMKAEIAFDADYEYFRSSGSSVAATVLNIESVLNAVTAIYERDVQITYELTQVIVRSSEPDPYTATVPGDLLNQFRDHWNTSQGSVVRDVAHFVTGREMDGNIIGLAWLPGVCSSSLHYGLSQFTFSFSSHVRITAHELGHNWNAPHCLDPCDLMCGGCELFGPNSTAVIRAYRDSISSCLEPVTLTTPHPPNAADDTYSVGSVMALDVLANDLDGNCDIVTIDSFDTLSAHGGTVTRSVGTGPSGRDELRYTPPAGFGGQDTFTYLAGDGTGLQDPATVTVQVRDQVPDLFAHYRLDEVAGTAARDASSFNQNGFYRRTPLLGRSGAATGTGTAVKFNGVDQRVAIVDAPALDELRSNLTVSAWVRPDVVGGAQAVLANAGSWAFGLRGSDLAFSVTGVQDYVLPANIQALRWTHVAATFDAGFDVTLYVDGTPLGTVNGTPGSPSPPAADKWFLATFDNSHDYFDGKLDDVQVYDIALNGAQVRFLYDNPGRTTCTPGWSHYGDGLAGSSGMPLLSPLGEPRLGTTLFLFVGNSRGAGTTGSLIFGLQPVSLPLLGGTLLVEPALPLTIIVPGTGALLPLPIPDDPGIWCQSLYFQVLEVDPGAPQGISFSSGLQVEVG